MLEFIQEMNEAKLFQNRDTLDGKTIKDLASTTYLMILILELLRTEEPKYAKSYANKTMIYDDFNKMRSNTTDLHNIVSILDNQEDYESKIKIDKTVTLPMFGLKRYLRDIQEDRKDPTQDRQLFIKLENQLKISSSTLKNIRRIVADWRSATSTEKRSTRNNIRTEFNKLSWQNDIFLHYK